MPPLGQPQQAFPPEVESGERLESWKEIAAFLGRGVRTVQRWEEVEGLPVHRHVHARGGTVFAYKAELQRWYANRQTLPSAEAETARATQGIVQIVSPKPTLERSWTRKWWLGAGAAALLLVGAAAGFLLIHEPPLGPPSILISQIGRISQTVYSPTGDRIVYCWNGDREENNLDLYIRDVRTGLNRRLTAHPNNEHSAAWSSAGDHIAFLRDKVGLFVTRPDGSDEQQLEAAQPGTVYGVGMSWSADGRWLVYSEKESADTPASLFLFDLATHKRRQITKPKDLNASDLYPSFSPTTRQLAFVRYWPGKSGVCLLRISESGEPTDFPELLSVGPQSIAGVDWLPHGKGLVFSSTDNGLRRLLRIRVWPWTRHAGEPEVLPGSEGGWQPSVARFAQSIVYSRRYWNASIWQMDLSSAASGPPILSRLIGSTRIERSPTYSSDGRRIAFVSDRSGFPEIWSCDRNGHDETQWTRFESLQPERPAWSPDASRIAFSLQSGGSEGIYIMNFAGDRPRRVSPKTVECNSPSWSHDGQSVYCSASSDKEQIWRVTPSGGPVLPVTSGSRPKESPDGAWLYFTREGALWRMRTGGQGAEKLIDAPVGDFVVTRRGIYFDLGSGDYTRGVINFYDLSKQKVGRVNQLERRKSGGLAISPDDRKLLFPINERQGSEVLLITQQQ